MTSFALKISIRIFSICYAVTCLICCVGFQCICLAINHSTIVFCAHFGMLSLFGSVIVPFCFWFMFNFSVISSVGNNVAFVGSGVVILSQLVTQSYGSFSWLLLLIALTMCVCVCVFILFKLFLSLYFRYASVVAEAVSSVAIGRQEKADLL